MVVTINGTDYELNFGIRFVRELDKKYFTQSQSGIRYGMGIETQVPLLLTGDPVALADIISLGTVTEKKRPTMQEIDDYIDHVDNIEELFDEVISELKKGNATRIKMREFTDLLEAEEKKVKAK